MKVLQVLTLIFGLTIFANSQTSILSGSVYDAYGALIIGAKIVAVNERFEKFESFTDDKGEYKLNLPFKRYDSTGNFKVSKYILKVEAKHFEPFEIKDFKFVPSYKGQMNLDFALDIQPIIDVITVENNKKQTNKTKRTTINNK